MTLWSSQCREGHTGVLGSKVAQESVPCLSLVCLWLASGVSTEHVSRLLQESLLTGKNQAVSSWHHWWKQACSSYPYLTPTIISNGSKRKGWRGTSSLLWRATGTYKQKPLVWPLLSRHNTSPHPPRDPVVKGALKSKVGWGCTDGARRRGGWRSPQKVAFTLLSSSTTLSVSFPSSLLLTRCC